MMRRTLLLILTAALVAPASGVPLVQRDTSGVFAGGNEVPSLRTRTTKTFRLPDAPDGRRRFRVAAAGPIHYRADPFTNDPYQEIDLDVVLTPGQGWDAACETNGYQVRFWQSVTRDTKAFRYVAQYRRAGRWLAMAPIAVLYENAAGERQVVGTPQAGITPVIDNEAGTVTWNNCFGTGLHFRYSVGPDKFFKQLVVRRQNDLPRATIGAAGRKLTLVMALEWDAEAAPSNGFAAGVMTSLGDGYTEVPDETLTDPGAYSQADTRGNLWWLQRPMAWDSSATPQTVPVAWRLQRKGGNVYAGFSVGQAALTAAVYPVYIDTAITEEVVDATTDDGYTSGTTWPGTTTNTLGITTDFLGGASTTTFTAYGARFITIPIPQGATIDSASLTVQSVYNNNASLRIKFYAHDTDDSATFADTTNTETGGPGFRTRTTANVEWNVGTTLWTQDLWYQSANFASVVQEVTDRAGWASGNDLTILVTHYTNTLPAVPSQRYISSRERGAARAPKFNCSYTEGSATAIGYIAGVPFASIAYVAGVSTAGISFAKVAGVGP